MTLRYDTVTFLSDYGLRDGFVGIVHSVLHQLAPGVRVVDLNHQVEPFDVRAGSWCLARSAQYLCPGVIMAVVDPGVGGSRRALGIEVADGGAVFVGPDNGLLAGAVAMVGGAQRIVELSNSEFHLPTTSSTFAGRDVFAPVAAHLCLGVDLGELGPELDPNDIMPGLVPLARVDGDNIECEVIAVDRFGNVQLNLGREDVEHYGERLTMVIGGVTRSAAWVESYDALGVGELGVLLDSDGLVSLVSYLAPAADDLGIGVGASVRVVAASESDGDQVNVTSVHLGSKGPS